MTEHDYRSSIEADHLSQPTIHQDQQIAQPRVLTAEEVKAVAGGPSIQNQG